MAKILVADDNEDARILLTESLSAQGYEVRATEDGLQALEIARAWRPDLVVSDVLMPGMDGFRLCQELGEDPQLRDTPFIIYTATYIDTKDRELAEALGAARFLTKPLSTEQLLVEVRSVLQEQQAHATSPAHRASGEPLRLDRLRADAVSAKLDQKVRQLEYERIARLEAEERMRLALQGSNEGIWDWDLRSGALYLSPRWKSMLGYGEQELPGVMDSFKRLLHPDDSEATWSALNDYLTGRRENLEVEYRLQHKMGHWVHILSRAFCLRDAHHNPYRVVGTHADISRRKQDEQELRRLNRLYATLSACNHALVKADDEPALMQSFCDNIVHRGGYSQVWIGRMDDVSPPLWKCLATAGRLAGSGASPGDLPGTGVARAACRDDRTVLVNHPEAPDVAGLLQAVDQDCGLGACISLPLKGMGETCTVLTICGAEPGVFSRSEIALLEELASDLGFGIQSMRSEQARRRAEAVLQLRERAINASSNGVVITDALAPDHPIVYANPAFLRTTGYDMDEVLGLNPRFLFGTELEQPGVRIVRAALRGRREATVTVRNFRKDGSAFWSEMRVSPVLDGAGRLTHYVGILNDITDRVNYQRELERQTNYDGVTGIANRNLLMSQLEQVLREARRRDEQVAVLFIDLDRFKQINDSFGHISGDLLLRTLANRLSDHYRDSDAVVARLSGDEFAVALSRVESEAAVAAAAEALRALLSAPIAVEGRSLRITCSIGVGIAPRDGQEAQELMRKADIAMYSVKQAGGDGQVSYRSEMAERISEHLSLENGLRQAIALGELQLVYQPQHRMDDGSLVGAEALLRWNSGELGPVSPARFIPVAEDTGLILPVGEWVIREACRQVAAWRDSGLLLERVAVNVSNLQMQRGNLPQLVRAALGEFGLPPRILELEVTESFVMDYNERSARVLDELQGLGVRLAIDDFGTGYSSLAYLKQLPVDLLKIDQSFVRGIPHDENDAGIARAVIALGNSLGLQVVAEGVETDAQRQFLHAERCDIGQGYLFGRPMTDRQFAEVLEHAALHRPAV
jgi:diguanylate cyclase (GGDEF)-like protein/PAS domain S-box-containing protein